MTTYVAFLRGINVGGKTIKMDALTKAFESFGCQNVRTILATGNVIFDSEEEDEKLLKTQLEAMLSKEFDLTLSLLIRPLKYIKELVVSNPFKTISSEPGLRMNVSFLDTKSQRTLTIPYESPDKHFKIISMTTCELFCVIFSDGKTTDAMELIEKKFGKGVTTRNWNTIQKIAMLE